MKRLVRFLTFGKHDPINDPVGGTTGGDPEYIDAYLRDDGFLEVTPNYFIPAVEGTQPGQYQSLSSAIASELSALKSSVTALVSDPDPDVAFMAEAIIAKLAQQNRRSIIQTLKNTAENTGATTDRRVHALILIGMLVEDVI